MRLLDFGCGSGGFLARMHAQGWHVTGVDASAAAVAEVREVLGLEAFHGTLPHPRLVPGSFDVVTMWESLEHLHQPLDALRHARTLLASGGRLYVSVPNIEGLPFRWFGEAWTGLDLPRHLTHFSPATLRAMLDRAGLVPGRASFVRHATWIARSAARAKRLRWLRFRPAARLAARWCALRGRGDCIMVEAEVEG